MDRNTARRQLGAAAILPEAEAVRLLTCADATARAWLRERGLVHDHPVLGRYVVWGEVLDELRRSPAGADGPPRAPSTLVRGGLRR